MQIIQLNHQKGEKNNNAKLKSSQYIIALFMFATE